MARPKKTKVEEPIEEVVEVVPEVQKPNLLTEDLGREDLNRLRDKINEVINHI